MRELKITSLELSLIIVIDTLNECENEHDIREVIQFFAKVEQLKKNRLRIFIINKQNTFIRFDFIEISKDQH